VGTRFVITGALGHIGSALTRYLPERFPGAEIVLIDNLATLRFCSLFNLPRSATFRFHEADVISDARLDDWIAGTDYVIHLAAITDATSSFENRAEVERVNFQATARVANACLRAGARMIHLSSTSVYGSQSERVDETCPIEELHPQSPYAETKLREERLIAELAATTKLKALTFRFGTIFGWSIGMRFHTAVNKFCWQAVMGEPLSVWRTAFEQKRPYLGVTDACRAICHVIEKDLFDGRIYNVVSENVTVRHVVEQIRHLIPESRVDFVDSRIMNQLSYEVIAERMAHTGFEALDRIEAGVRETIEILGGTRS
jgi:UDP-glucose 4-epimerase